MSLIGQKHFPAIPVCLFGLQHMLTSTHIIHCLSTWFEKKRKEAALCPASSFILFHTPNRKFSTKTDSITRSAPTAVTGYMHKVLQFLWNNNTKIKIMSYYAVANGRNVGVYRTWDECKNQVHQFGGAKYKKFSSLEEAQAFVDSGPSRSTGNSRASGNSSSTGGYTSKSNGFSRSYSTYDDDEEDRTPSYKKPRFTESTTQRKMVGQNYFQVDSDNYVNVWTDGACSSNGRGGAKAGIGAYFDDGHPLNISRAVDERSTNNYAEIKAVTEAAKQASRYGVKKLKVNTDSKFLINCLKEWMPKWKKNGWRTSTGEPVINKAELLELEGQLKKFDNVEWKHVRGHQGNHGNEMADKLARQGAEGRR